MSKSTILRVTNIRDTTMAELLSLQGNMYLHVV